MNYFNLSAFYKDEIADENNINNRPSEKFIDNILELAHDLVEPMRSAWGKYCRDNELGDPKWDIISGYRSLELNTFYEAKKSSPHIKGFAIDFTLRNNGYAFFYKFAENWLKENDINFDELIWNIDEHFIHLSIKNCEGKQRRHIKKLNNENRQEILD